MRDDNMQQKQEQEEREQWEAEHMGMFECMYCGKIYHEAPTRGCCGEVHFNVIGEQSECV